MNPHCEEVIIATESRGAGTSEDPCRTVLMVFRKDGSFIAENDPGVAAIFIPEPVPMDHKEGQ